MDQPALWRTSVQKVFSVYHEAYMVAELTATQQLYWDHKPSRSWRRPLVAQKPPLNLYLLPHQDLSATPRWT